MIFEGTVSENIHCYRGMEDKLSTFLNDNGLLELLEYYHLPLDHKLKTDGKNLSAGEKQLLSLCRVLWQNPSILIFDEATGNMDEGLEASIQSHVNSLDHTTRITIAHRLKTLKECDRILVFKDGHLIEEGPQENLLNKKGYFYQLNESSNSRQFL